MSKKPLHTRFELNSHFSGYEHLPYSNSDIYNNTKNAAFHLGKSLTP